MIRLRYAQDRGASDLGWLQSKHTFSFGEYHDPEQIGFESLRVINEDRVKAGQGFGTHPHADMEIISYVLSGALEHKDSLGNGSIIKPGDVQRMSAGTGVTHSEFNPSQDESVHFLQIWFLPDEKGAAPSYEQKTFSPQDKLGEFRLVASKSGRDGSVSLHQDVDMSVALLNDTKPLSYALADNRCAWIHLARGSVTVNGETLKAGDGAAVTNEPELRFQDGEDAEILVFDMAKC